MSKTTYERGKTLTYPSIYPILTFTPIFGHRGDFVWIEEVKVAWPEHDSEFAFVRSTVHDERVDRLQTENEKLRELVRDVWEAWQCSEFSMIPKLFDRICELGVEVDG